MQELAKRVAHIKTYEQLEREAPQLTVLEIQNVKYNWYEEALGNRLVEKVSWFARELGHAVDARGIEYEWRDGEHRVLFKYGAGFKAWYGDRLVADSADKLFVHGEWLRSLLEKYDELYARWEARERARLLDQLRPVGQATVETRRAA
jgi:hypothetical protein